MQCLKKTENVNIEAQILQMSRGKVHVHKIKNTRGIVVKNKSKLVKVTEDIYSQLYESKTII